MKNNRNPDNLAEEHATRLTSRLNLIHFGSSFNRTFLAPASLQKMESEIDRDPDDSRIDHCEIKRASPEPPKIEKKQRPFKRGIRIFDPQRVAHIREISKRRGKEARDRVSASLKLAEKHGGFRRLPDFLKTHNRLDKISGAFENFSEVLEHFRDEMLLAGMIKSDGFRIAPILLDGPPGVGKTAFSQKLADTLGLPFRKISAGGMQHASLLNGTSSHWSNAEPGEIFNMLADGPWGSGVLLLDEADKFSDRQEYSILPAMLDLLEVETSRRYTDESLGLQFDASRLIVILTSNHAATMNDALRSRCKTFGLREPGPRQKILIAIAEHDGINRRLPASRRLRLDMGAIEKLAIENISTRTLVQAVRDGFSRALRKGNGVSVPVLQEIPEPEARHIGFV